MPVPKHMEKLINDIMDGIKAETKFTEEHFNVPEYLERNGKKGWKLELYDRENLFYEFDYNNIKKIHIKYFPSALMKPRENFIQVVNGSAANSLTKSIVAWLGNVKQHLESDSNIESRFGGKKVKYYNQETEYVPFEEINESEPISEKEKEDIKLLLAAYQNEINSSDEFTQEQKLEFEAKVQETNKKLDSSPTKGIYKWMGEWFRAYTIKLLTDENARQQVVDMFESFLNVIQTNGHLLLDNAIKFLTNNV